MKRLAPLALLFWTIAPAHAELGFTEAPKANAVAAPTGPRREQALAAQLRERLTAPVETLLQEHCGEDCPSFRIEPQFKKAAAAAEPGLEDLGFSKPLPPDSPPELSSVAVTVLIHERVSQKARESLRKILAARVSTEANVPASVRVMPLDAMAPLMEKRLHPEAASLGLQEKINLIKASAWPVCALLLAGIGLLALVLVLRHRMALDRARVAAEERALERQQAQERSTEVHQAAEEALLPQRADDLRWLIEDAATRGDKATLGKVLSIVPTHELSRATSLSESALAVLAELPAAPTSPANATWLRTELDRAHWGRLEEQANRLSRLRRLPVQRLAQVFSRLTTMGMRAAFVASLPEDRWPKVLAVLSSDERVELGMRLADYAAATPEAREVLVSQLAAELSRLDDSLATRSEAALESFSLYLSEKEGQRLWQQLSAKTLAPKRAPRSVDAVLMDLDPQAAVEICSRLDVGTLSVVLTQVSSETRDRIYAHLPKALQARLGDKAGREPAEPEVIRARAALMTAFHQMDSGLVQ